MAAILKNLWLIIFHRHNLPVNGCKMALVVRTDINMGKGKTAAQCAHAALECYREALKSNRNRAMLSMWEISGQPKIVLKISSQTELLVLAQRAEKIGVITATIRDAGRTQLTPGTISVLGLGPGSKEDIEKLTANLKLL